jgi:hypothetical protein
MQDIPTPLISPELPYNKIQTLSGFLSWIHYTEILKADDGNGGRF